MSCDATRLPPLKGAGGTAGGVAGSAGCGVAGPAGGETSPAAGVLTTAATGPLSAGVLVVVPDPQADIRSEIIRSRMQVMPVFSCNVVAS